MKTLVLFFTYGTSLEDWVKNGTFERETAIYTRYLEHFEKIYFLTYGENDSQYQERLPQQIVILPKKSSLPLPLYSFLLPVLYYKELQTASWFKTNQMLGSWSAVLAKIIFRKKLAVRTGYTESLFLFGKSHLKKILVHIIEFLAYKLSDLAIVTSNHQKQYLLATYGVKNLHVLPNGVDTQLFSCPTRNTSESIIQILFVGRLHPEKNVISLIQALSPVSNIFLTIVGKGPLEQEVRSLAKEQGLPLKIIPSVPNSLLPEIYRQAELYVQPSLYEGSPKTIIEAMSCGLPVIATDIEGTRDVITHKQNGYLCAPDPLSIRAAVEEIRDNPILRNHLSQEARDFARKHYDIIKLIQTELSLYA